MRGGMASLPPLATPMLMFATSHADAGSKACERIVRLLLFIAQQ